MLAQTTPAPFVPEMDDEFDASNFQEFDSDEEDRAFKKRRAAKTMGGEMFPPSLLL